jgi:fructosamine-3-kinase
MRDDVWSPDFLPHGRSSRRIRHLPGGFANPVWLCGLDDGEDVVVKASTEDCADMFATEAAGLEVLARLGGLTTPRVLAVGPRSIVLEALDPELPDKDEF